MTPWDGQPKFEGEVPKPVATRVSREPSGRLRRVKPSEVVVSRTDLEEAIVALESLTDDVVWGEMIERLSAVLNTENQT
jgi:hypothetical protein